MVRGANRPDRERMWPALLLTSLLGLAMAAALVLLLHA